MELASHPASRPLSRHRLLQLVGIAGGGIALGPGGLLRAGAASAASSTAWSDVASWGGAVPGPNDVATVSGSVVLDVSARVAGVIIEPGGALIFEPTNSVALESSGNVVVKGLLTMRPSTSAVHRLVYVDVDEAALARANPWSLRSALGYHHDVSAL